MIKRRALAKWMCENWAIEVNGHPAKASRWVEVGDHIALHHPGHTRVVEVLFVPRLSEGGRVPSASREARAASYRSGSEPAPFPITVHAEPR